MNFNDRHFSFEKRCQEWKSGFKAYIPAVPRKWFGSADCNIYSRVEQFNTGSM